MSEINQPNSNAGKPTSDVNASSKSRSWEGSSTYSTETAAWGMVFPSVIMLIGSVAIISMSVAEKSPWGLLVGFAALVGAIVFMVTMNKQAVSPSTSVKSVTTTANQPPTRSLSNEDKKLVAVLERKSDQVIITMMPPSLVGLMITLVTFRSMDPLFWWGLLCLCVVIVGVIFFRIHQYGKEIDAIERFTDQRTPQQ